MSTIDLFRLARLLVFRQGPQLKGTYSNGTKVAENSLHSAGNLAMTGHNVQSLGAKGLAKRVAKDTGKQLINEHEAKKQDKPPRPPPPA